MFEYMKKENIRRGKLRTEKESESQSGCHKTMAIFYERSSSHELFLRPLLLPPHNYPPSSLTSRRICMHRELSWYDVMCEEIYKIYIFRMSEQYNEITLFWEFHFNLVPIFIENEARQGKKKKIIQRYIFSFFTIHAGVNFKWEWARELRSVTGNETRY